MGVRPLFTALVLLFLAGMITYAQQEGSDAPDFEVNLLDGGTFKLSDQEGKVVMVFLFGNTCPYCISSGPSLESEIYQVFKDDTSFIAVGLDTWDQTSNTSSVTGFRNSTGITFPLAVKAGSVAESYGTTYDRLMVIDHNGILVHKGTLPSANDIGNTKTVIQESLDAIEDGVLGTGAVDDGFSPGVYPNPVSERLYISSEGETSTTFYSLTGQQILQTWNKEIDVSSFERGIYLVKVSSRDDTRTLKIAVR